MRNPKRIDRIINTLSEIRHQNPDLRFTQLLSIAGINNTVVVGDTTGQQMYIHDNFHVEDDVIEKKLNNFRDYQDFISIATGEKKSDECKNLSTKPRIIYSFPDMIITEGVDTIRIHKCKCDDGAIFMNTKWEATDTSYDFVLNDTVPNVIFPSNGIKKISFYTRPPTTYDSDYEEKEDYD